MAVDDAYSKYVMALDPCRYLRLRDVAVGHRALADESATGVSREYPGRAMLASTLTASHVGSGSLLPAFPGGTHFKFAGNNRIHLCPQYPYDYSFDTTYTTALTSNFLAVTQTRPRDDWFTFNYWMRVPESYGAVNHRFLCLMGAETTDTTQSGSHHNAPGLHVFSWSWNAGDNMLIEHGMKRRATLLGTGNLTNPGNNELWRYHGIPAGTLTTPYMYTLRYARGVMGQYRNGVKVGEYTFPWKTYRTLLTEPTGKSPVLGAASFNGGYSYFDYCTTEEFSEISLHHRPLSDAEIAELYYVGANGYHSRRIEGTVTDGVGSPLARMVRAHRSDTGALMGETTSAGDGTFTLRVPASYTGNYYVVAFDDLGVAPDYNAAIQSSVVAVT